MGHYRERTCDLIYEDACIFVKDDQINIVGPCGIVSDTVIKDSVFIPAALRDSIRPRDGNFKGRIGELDLRYDLDQFIGPENIRFCLSPVLQFEKAQRDSGTGKGSLFGRCIVFLVLLLHLVFIVDDHNYFVFTGFGQPVHFHISRCARGK